MGRNTFIAYCVNCNNIVIKDLEQPCLLKGKLKCPHCKFAQELEELRYETQSYPHFRLTKTKK